MNEVSNAPIPSGMPPAPESFFQVWIKAITKPAEQTFAEMAASPNAKQMTAYLWVFIGFLVNFILSSLVSNVAMRQIMQQYGMDSRLLEGGGIGATLVRAVCGGPILALIATIFFAIGVYILQWIAKMFGGKGTADQLAYALAAISAPVSIISGVLSLFGAIPFVGLCFGLFSFLLSIYVIVLEIIAIKGVNQISWGAAIGTFFIPALVVLCICGCIVLITFAALGPAIGNVFSTINQSLGY